MHSKLPTPDTEQTFTHVAFKDLLTPFQPAIMAWKKASPEVSLVIKVKAYVGASDIKWNDFAGSLRGVVVDTAGVELCNLFSCQLVHFTGNCGIKAIDHLEIGRIPGMTTAAKEALSDACRAILTTIESFAYHKTNCGVLTGSDTNCRGSVHGFKGNTIVNIEKFGSGYIVTDPTWNPNYTWSKGHQISLFWKDLNASSHQDYWQ